jgi:hypothetical protein
MIMQSSGLPPVHSYADRSALPNWKHRFADWANRLLRPFGAEVHSTGSLQWWSHSRTFQFAGHRLYYFFHHHNCGWPPHKCTERTVELAVANRWLDGVEGAVWEIGAVTPYYWPGRVSAVIDPADGHRLVTHQQSMFDLDLTGRVVLSISTLEHIGSGEYGLEQSIDGAPQALQKIFAESPRFLVTFPVGCNKALDQFVFDAPSLPADVCMRYVVRAPDGLTWREARNPAEARRPYGCDGRNWGNSVAILERGGLFGEPA